MTQSRRYRTRLPLLTIYPMAGAACVLGVGLAIGPRGDLGIRLLAICLVIATIGIVIWVKRIGLEVSPSGLVVRRALHTHVLDWRDVARLEVRPRGASHELDLLLRNGETVHSTLLQGRVVAWQGGRTKDILSVLESERAAATSRPS